MKRIALHIVLVLHTGLCFTQGIAWKNGDSDVCQGYINISGTTNINHFNFSNELSSIWIPAAGQDGPPEDSSIFEIRIPIKDFRTNNPVMYRDFLELVSASIYPYIYIGIHYPYLKRILTEGVNTIPEFEITLAGVRNEYRIPCRVWNCGVEHVLVSGSREVRLTEFKLDPPEKFQGLVKVHDSVLINFSLVFGLQSEIKLSRLESKY